MSEIDWKTAHDIVDAQLTQAVIDIGDLMAAAGFHGHERVQEGIARIAWMRARCDGIEVVVHPYGFHEHSCTLRLPAIPCAGDRIWVGEDQFTIRMVDWSDDAPPVVILSVDLSRLEHFSEQCRKAIEKNL